MIDFKKLPAKNLSVCAFINEGEDKDIKDDYVLMYNEKQDNGELTTRLMLTSSDNVKQKPILVEEKFNYYAKKNGFESVIQKEYDIETLTNIISAINFSSEIKKREDGQKENLIYDEMIEKAADWWCSKLINPRVIKQTEGNISTILQNIPSGYIHEEVIEAIERFKYYLIGQIKVGLYNKPNSFIMTADFGPDIYLQRAINKAGLIAQFPNKTTMVFSGLNVRVIYNNALEYERIYFNVQNAAESPKQKELKK